MLVFGCKYEIELCTPNMQQISAKMKDKVFPFERGKQVLPLILLIIDSE